MTVFATILEIAGAWLIISVGRMAISDIRKAMKGNQ